MGELVVEVFARTDVGLARESNQDSFLVGDLDGGEAVATDPLWRGEGARGPVLVVCDGMGGAAGGEVASQLAAEVVWGEMRAAAPPAERDVYARVLRRAVRLANRRVWEEAQRQPKLRGMGTTLSAAGVAGDALIVAQVGDSRAYVQRGSTLTQVTRDQSIVSALVHAGRITPEEARASGRSNMILQALGAHVDVDVSLSLVDLRAGDRLLLCSDGLHGAVPDELIRATLASCPDLDEAVATLISLAHRAGAPDNVTAVVARFTGAALRAADSEDDLPRFVEINPQEEGERALATTSWVARRLAARAGLADDPGPPVLPTTGQHPVYSGQVPEPGDRDVADDPRGPAAAVLAERERLGLVAWVVAALAAIALLAWLLWDRI